jgi:ABC-type iron transport system FetAB ATPase subunit
MVELFLRKKYDNFSFNYLILKNKKIIWVTHNETQSNPENNGFTQPDPML